MKRSSTILVLTIKDGETVGVGDVLVTLVRSGDGKVRLGFEGPKEIAIVRQNAKNKAPGLPIDAEQPPAVAVHFNHI